MKASLSPLKVGDTVELLPTNNRNRQLRSQDKKVYWKVINSDGGPLCFGGRPGVLIEAAGDRSHSRWVEPQDIKIVAFSENDIRD